MPVIELSNFFNRDVRKSHLLQDSPPQDVDVNGRPIRMSTKKKVNYDLMIATENDADDDSPKRKKSKKNIEKDEEELEQWAQAMVQNQESMNYG